MSAKHEIYARLAPYAPKQGRFVQRLSHRSMMFLGGIRPTWYLIDPGLAEELREMHQVPDDPESKLMFEIVDGERKAQIEKVEQEKFLASMGMISETIPLPRDVKQPSTFDMRTDETGGRATAIPRGRVPTQKQTKSGAIVSADIKSGLPNAD